MRVRQTITSPAAVIFACGTIHLCLAAFADARATEAQSPAIEVTGNKRVDPDVIRSRFHLDPKHELSPQQLDDAVKSLYSTHLFSDVRVRKIPTGVHVSVAENAKIARIAFEGNKAV